MKYFLDTEFIERPGSIQLVSIGIVDENGRTFYAENTSFDEREADDWVKENVLSKLRWWPHRAPFKALSNLKHHEIYGPITWIRRGLLEFLEGSSPEFWGYLAGYDWVIFCWIFGKMIDLPAGFPMYCNDIEQLMVERGITAKVVQEPGTEHDALEDALWNKRQYHEVTRQGIFRKSPTE